MINIDFLTLKAFFTENADFIINARVQKIQQPTRRDFVFYLRNKAETKKLYVNINPKIYHIAFMGTKEELRRGLKIPKQPPMFCMLLRKYLEGSRIIDASVVENERIIEFYFNITDEFSQPRELCLCIELMGKHSNVILYDRKTSVIIGCAHNVGSEKSRYRELQGGLTYIYPPKATGFSNELNNQFNGLSREKINYYLTTEQYSPAIKDDKYTLFSELLDGSEPVSTVNEMIDSYYSAYQEKINLNTEKNKIVAYIDGKLKKTNSAINKIDTLLKKRDNTEKYKLYGELLTANLHEKNYDKNITVLNYYTGENVTIELDITKTLNENAQRYYRLYAKSKTTKEKSAEILNNLYIEKDYYENVLYSISNATNLDELDDIAQELGLTEKEKTRTTPPLVTKIDVNGFEVYIGKNNKQNDYIVSKLAKDEDFWFHTRLCAGSHVLLKVESSEPDEETIFECCKLARENSSAKQPSKVGVVYTKRKFVKKPVGAPLGYVIYKNEKEILV